MLVLRLKWEMKPFWNIWFSQKKPSSMFQGQNEQKIISLQMLISKKVGLATCFGIEMSSSLKQPNSA